jgi:tetratricopeptide (TPR) repeat protein
VKGWCDLWAGEGARAREHFEEALQLNPYNKARLVEVATAFMFLGALDRAAELLERCRTLTPFATEAPYEEEGFLHLLRGEYAEAAERLALSTRTHPDDCATGGPTVMSELYTLLAAAGLGSDDLGARAGAWRAAMESRWSGAEPLDLARLEAWVLFHHPFQAAGERDRFTGLLDRALKASSPRPRARARAES